MEKNNLKIAYVKSSVYQDFWVSNIDSNIIDIFKTTLVRCSPIGICECFDTDFIIVKDCDEYPCNINKNCLDKKFYNDMQYSKKLKNPGLPFLDETYHSHISIDSVSHNVDDIE